MPLSCRDGAGHRREGGAIRPGPAIRGRAPRTGGRRPRMPWHGGDRSTPGRRASDRRDRLRGSHPGRPDRAVPGPRSSMGRCRGSPGAAQRPPRGAGGGASRSTRPEATSRAAAISARERPAESPHLWSRAGDSAATISALGASTSPLSPSRRPWRWTIRRLIASARSSVISCSQTAQTRTSNGTGPLHGRAWGAARTEGPIRGSSRKRSKKPDRSSSAPVQNRSRLMPISASRSVRARAARSSRPPRGTPGARPARRRGG